MCLVFSVYPRLSYKDPKTCRLLEKAVGLNSSAFCKDPGCGLASRLLSPDKAMTSDAFEVFQAGSWLGHGLSVVSCCNDQW